MSTEIPLVRVITPLFARAHAHEGPPGLAINRTDVEKSGRYERMGGERERSVERSAEAREADSGSSHACSGNDSQEFAQIVSTAGASV